MSLYFFYFFVQFSFVCVFCFLFFIKNIYRQATIKLNTEVNHTTNGQWNLNFSLQSFLLFLEKFNIWALTLAKEKDLPKLSFNWYLVCTETLSTLRGDMKKWNLTKFSYKLHQLSQSYCPLGSICLIHFSANFTQNMIKSIRFYVFFSNLFPLWSPDYFHIHILVI